MNYRIELIEYDSESAIDNSSIRYFFGTIESKKEYKKPFFVAYNYDNHVYKFSPYNMNMHKMHSFLKEEKDFIYKYFMYK